MPKGQRWLYAVAMDPASRPALMFLPAPLLFGFVVGILVSVLSSWIWGLVAFLAAAAFMAVLLYVFADAIALRLIGARPLAESGSLTLRNQLEELCARAGISEPDLYTTGAGAPAIASLGRTDPKIIVSDGLCDDLTVVELEAAVARELGRIRTGATAGDTLAVPFLTAPFGWLGSFSSRALDWFRGGDHDARVDLQGIEITRYPPGLMAALNKMTDSGTPAGSAATRHLWAAGTRATSDQPGNWGLDDRLQMLNEL